MWRCSGIYSCVYLLCVHIVATQQLSCRPNTAVHICIYSVSFPLPLGVSLSRPHPSIVFDPCSPSLPFPLPQSLFLVSALSLFLPLALSLALSLTLSLTLYALSRLLYRVCSRPLVCHTLCVTLYLHTRHTHTHKRARAYTIVCVQM